MMGELSRRLNADAIDIGAGAVARRRRSGAWSPASPIARSRTTPAARSSTRSGPSAGTDVDALIESLGLRQTNDAGELDALVDGVLAANEKSVAEYRAGKEKAFNALVGQVMKATRGKANPEQVNALLKKRLG